jgi:AraC-like DNA-binding protein
MMKNSRAAIRNFKIADLKCGEEQPHADFAIYAFEYFAQDIAHLFKPHRHDFYTLLLVTEGTGCHDIDYQTYKIQPWRLFFISPGQIHAWREINSNTKGYIVFFTADFFELRYHNHVLAEFPFFNSVQNLPYIDLAGNSKAYLHKIVEIMYCEYLSKEAYLENILRSYLNILLCELARRYRPESHPDSHNSQQYVLFRNFENLVNQHFIDKKHVKDYAAMLFVTPNYLNEVCNKISGNSAGEIIRKRIVIEAKRLLAHTSKTISQIADELAFEDSSYFSRFFKKNAGLTPEQFRKESSL